MATTLTESISATDNLIRLTGYPGGATRGTYLIDDEIIVLQSFGTKQVENATYGQPRRQSPRVPQNTASATSPPTRPAGSPAPATRRTRLATATRISTSKRAVST